MSGRLRRLLAAYSDVTAVNATDQNDDIAPFSSRNPEVELAAPGADLATTDAGSRCTTLSGTSFATAHVSGVAAFLFGQGYSNTGA